MKLSDLLKNVEVKSKNFDSDFNIENVVYDSRKVTEGCMFICIRGYTTDGHKYISDAIEKKAKVIVTEQPINKDVFYIEVPDTRVAMAAISANLYENPSHKFKLIGVTGTNGKTTTTYLIKSILEEAGKKVGLIGTNQNIVGNESIEASRTTPESYELQKLFSKMADVNSDYVVMEVSSHSLYLNRVAHCMFSSGVFTNLTQDHLDFHKTMDEYCKAKAILFDVCKKGAINTDSSFGKQIYDNAKCQKYSYGINRGHIKAVDVEMKSEGVYFKCITPDWEENMFLGIPGKFSVYNALSAISAAYMEGIKPEIIKEGLKKAHSVKGRAQSVYNKDFMVVIDYAHTPDGLENIISAMRAIATGRIVTVFGCGGNRDKTKRPIMGKTAVSMSDFSVITSDNPRCEKPSEIIEDILTGLNGYTNYEVVENRYDAIEYAIKNAQKNDIIILAGKGHETYQEINNVKHHFDESEIVDEILTRLNLK